ncbi:MAG: hypothetical protein J0I41_00235 [Filimonas sp.]|nr:hypothetical protein [Filimonas sp.]
MPTAFKPLSKDQVQMSMSLLLLVIFYPGYAPVPAFSSLAFEDKRYSLVLEGEGTLMFVDVINCEQQQIDFFNEKIKEVEALAGTVESLPNDLTRFSIRCR